MKSARFDLHEVVKRKNQLAHWIFIDKWWKETLLPYAISANQSNFGILHRNANDCCSNQELRAFPLKRNENDVHERYYYLIH